MSAPKPFRLLILLLVLPLGLAAARPASAQIESGALAALLAGGGKLVIAGRAVDRAPVADFYRGDGFNPVWTPERRAVLAEVLAEAPSHGLDPAAFAVPKAAPAQTEILLTDAFLRYATALGRGRVAPAAFESDWLMPQPSVNAVQALSRALSAGIAPILTALAPPDPAYGRLRQAYLRYRDYVSGSAWRPLALPLPLKRGDRGDAVVTLRRRLAAEGLAPVSDDPAFDDGLAAAVARFQAARGLPPDGSVASATLAALNISPGERLREIRLNLERWRSMPRDNPASRVEVNIPGASVVLFQDNQPTLTMHSVVGQIDHPSPVMRMMMTAVLLNPPWNVPNSIIVNEIRPALKKDPDYLKRNRYAYVDVAGGKQLIQLPGADNALGRIKFEMPNPLDIYLHDTPAPSLFDRSRRALSHGCIRVDNPRELARLVLAGDPAWPMDAIDAAIATGKTRSVKLPHAIPVYLFYRTAWVDADGTVEFRNDVYGRDQRLNQALAQRDRKDQRAPDTRADAVPGKG